MTRGIYTKWIITAVSILLIVATVCILYYQQTTAADRHAAAQDKKLLETWKADKAKPPTPAQTESTKPPAESTTPTAEKPTTDTTQDNNTITTENPTPKVSPFGLGEYPKIPKEWNTPYLWKNCESIQDELLTRVIIKMENEGIFNNYSSVGINHETGMITPLEHGSVIIEYDIDENGEKKIWSVFGHPDEIPQGIYTRESEIPSHLKIVTTDEIAIDPYEYLGIAK